MVAVEMRDSSMNHVIPAGSVVLVDTNETNLVDGNLYVIVAGTDLLVRRFDVQPRRFAPVSTFLGFVEIFETDAVEIVGRVKRAVINLDV